MVNKNGEFNSVGEQLALLTKAEEIRNEANERLESGTLVERNGLIIPKDTPHKNEYAIYVQPLRVEVEPDMWITFDALVFEGLTQPKGPLVDNFACHGLMYYAIKAFKQWYERTQDLSYEDDPDLHYNFAGMFKTTALHYAVDPDKMHRYWPVVKKAFKIMFNWELPPDVVRAAGVKSFRYAE